MMPGLAVLDLQFPTCENSLTHSFCNIKPGPQCTLAPVQSSSILLPLIFKLATGCCCPAEQTINMITEEHNEENGKTSFSLPAGEISFAWHGGRPCSIRLEKHVPLLPAPPAQPALPGISEENVPPVHTFEVEDAKNHIV